MSYDRDEAMRQQEATEAVIRMRDRLPSSSHPDPRDALMAEMLAVLIDIANARGQKVQGRLTPDQWIAVKAVVRKALGE